jgi:hypothetical protein
LKDKTRNLELETRNLNYFNYFTEIEDTFVRRRGKHLLLSPMDWALIESWKEMKVPLHVALRGIEKAFDSWEAKPRKRSVKTLLYCQEEVEAQYAEWLESRVGAGSEHDEEAGAAREVSPEDVGLPFSRRAVVQFLQRVRSGLLQTCRERKQVNEDELTVALTRAARLLEDLERDFTEAARPDAQKLEVSLTGLERMLNDSIRSVTPAEQLDAASQEVKEQLRPYRSHMEATAYKKTFENLLLKRLREQLNIPRLSLFYL